MLLLWANQKFCSKLCCFSGKLYSNLVSISHSHGNHVHLLPSISIIMKVTSLPMFLDWNNTRNCCGSEIICWFQNSLVSNWGDLSLQELLPWFFCYSMFMRGHRFRRGNIVRTFWGITQIVIWYYLKIIIKKVIANRWITLNFHN